MPQQLNVPAIRQPVTQLREAMLQLLNAAILHEDSAQDIEDSALEEICRRHNSLYRFVEDGWFEFDLIIEGIDIPKVELEFYLVYRAAFAHSLRSNSYESSPNYSYIDEYLEDLYEEWFERL